MAGERKVHGNNDLRKRGEKNMGIRSGAQMLVGNLPPGNLLPGICICLAPGFGRYTSNSFVIGSGTFLQGSSEQCMFYNRNGSPGGRQVSAQSSSWFAKIDFFLADYNVGETWSKWPDSRTRRHRRQYGTRPQFTSWQRSLLYWQPRDVSEDIFGNWGKGTVSRSRSPISRWRLARSR